jgi:hypothetical protein
MTEPSRLSRPSRTLVDLGEHRDDRVFAPHPNRRVRRATVAPRQSRHLGIPSTRDGRDGRDGHIAELPDRPSSPGEPWASDRAARRRLTGGTTP